MIGFCTDSNSCLPPELAERYGVEIVPLTVTVDGEEFLEGVDLDADAFFARFEGGRQPAVATAAPGPGRFAAAYDRLAGRGATEILSVDIGSTVSGTLNSARVAARGSRVPVRLVDTGTASFAISLCLWEEAEAVGKGASLDEAAAVAESVAAKTGNVFIDDALHLARAGGRLADSVRDNVAVAVLSLVGGKIVKVGEAASVEAAAEVMAAAVVGFGSDLRVGLTVADAGAAPLWQVLEARLTNAAQVTDLARYRLAPSVAAHTGPGTAAIYYPTA